MKISEMTISEARNVYHVNFGEAFENHYDWLYRDDVKKMWKNINELYSKLNSLELNSLYFGFEKNFLKDIKKRSKISKTFVLLNGILILNLRLKHVENNTPYRAKISVPI